MTARNRYNCENPGFERPSAPDNAEMPVVFDTTSILRDLFVTRS